MWQGFTRPARPTSFVCPRLSWRNRCSTGCSFHATSLHEKRMAHMPSRNYHCNPLVSQHTGYFSTRRWYRPGPTPSAVYRAIVHHNFWPNTGPGPVQMHALCRAARHTGACRPCLDSTGVHADLELSRCHISQIAKLKVNSIPGELVFAVA
jgi:hypothetical protein